MHVLLDCFDQHRGRYFFAGSVLMMGCLMFVAESHLPVSWVLTSFQVGFRSLTVWEASMDVNRLAETVFQVIAY